MKKDDIAFKINTAITCLSFIFFFICCTGKNIKKLYKNPISPQIINSLNLGAYRGNYNPDFGQHYSVINDSANVIFLSNNDSLILGNIESGRIRKIGLSKYKKLISSLISVKIKSDTINVFNCDEFTLSRYKIAKDSVVFIGLNSAKSLLSDIGFNVNYNFNNLFDIKWPYIYIRYTIPNASKAFLDDNACIKGMATDKGEFVFLSKILHHPKRYRKGYVYDREHYLHFINDSIMLYGFASFDSIYLYDPLKDKFIKSGQFNKKSNYINFKDDNSTDLAPIRFYWKTNENNFKMLSNNGYILILKHLRRKKMYDKRIVEYFLLNNDLKVQSNDTLIHGLNGNFCFGHKNGFLLFDSTLKKSYYYEVH